MKSKTAISSFRMSGQEPVEFMEEENDRGGKEGEGVEAHKSVILHLIKQVRIGMDLTTGKFLQAIFLK